MQRLASRMVFFVVAYAWVCTFTPGGWDAVAGMPSHPDRQRSMMRAIYFQGTFATTELFFGSDKPKGKVTEKDFQRFLDR